MKTTLPEILSTQNFEAIRNWLEDPEAAAPEFAQSFMTQLDSVYMERTGKPIRKTPAGVIRRMSLDFLLSGKEENKTTEPEPKNETAEKILDMIADTPKMNVTDEKTIGDDLLPLTDENGFKEAGLDSVRLAGAVAWHWQQLENKYTLGKPISGSLLQTTVYIIYGTLLAERGTRITTEHPQMWRFGPVFPRIYTRFSKRGIVPSEKEAAEIKESDPVLDEFIRRIIRINASKKRNELSERHTSKSSPWGVCNKMHPEQWSTQLDDKEIQRWFRKEIDNSN